MAINLAEPQSSFRPACSRQAKAGIQESGGTAVKGRQVLPDTRLRLLHLLPFPLRGNG